MHFLVTQSEWDSVHSTQHTTHNTQYTEHSTQHTAHSTQHTVHSTCVVHDKHKCNNLWLSLLHAMYLNTLNKMHLQGDWILECLSSDSLL